LFLNFALQYAISRDQVHQDGLKPEGAHSLVVYADDVNRLGRSVHTIKENTEASVHTAHSLVVYYDDVNRLGRSVHTIKKNTEASVHTAHSTKYSVYLTSSHV